MKPELKKIEGGSVFRRIAMGSWRTAGDPSVYGLLEIDVTKVLAWMSQQQAASSAKISISHVIGKAMLSGEVVRQAENLSVHQIAEQLAGKTEKIKNGGKGELTASINFLRIVPWSLMYWVLNFNSFLTYGLGLNLSWLGLSRDPFGSVMITNVGSLGIDVAWAPLVPYTRVPLLLTVGEIKPRPWIVDARVEVRPVIRIGITFDHRFMDGVHASAMNKIFTACFEEPEKYLTS